MTSAAFTDDTIEEITREIWSAMIDDAGSLEHRGAAKETDGLTGSVAISGSWNGTFDVWFSKAAARQATAKMFAAEIDQLTDADIWDAVGELVNIIGGNLKSLLPSPAVLSLPTVTDGTRAGAGLDEAQHVSELRFAWLEEPILISVRHDAGAQ